jgi:alkylation response protein AidB-like acyl-CoA dehydrogenase
LLIPTNTPGVVRRPFASASDRDDVDFNEVFFTDVRVPAANLVGQLNRGWQVATGSLGHERTMLWMGYADRLRELVVDFRPSRVLERDRYATLVMDTYALQLLGSAVLARADRGEEDVPALSVLKLLGSEAVQSASEHALNAAGADGLVHPAVTGPVAPLNLDDHYGSWFDRYFRSFAGTIAGGTSEIQRNIIAERVLGLPRN